MEGGNHVHLISNERRAPRAPEPQKSVPDYPCQLLHTDTSKKMGLDGISNAASQAWHD